ncbi:bifunctional DNA primase/polymerase (plasmid) [Streptomyces virginiae]
MDGAQRPVRSPGTGGNDEGPGATNAGPFHAKCPSPTPAARIPTLLVLGRAHSPSAGVIVPDVLPTSAPEPVIGSSEVARPPADLGAHQLAVALEWSRRGLPVIPCSRKDKRPMVGGFGRTATAEDMAPFFDADQVRAWWTGRYRRAHVGLLTGRSRFDHRGLVVIDLDMLKPDAAPLPEEFAYASSGADVLEHLAAEAGADWPDTYTVLTPSGGVHLYFEQPADGPLIGCATGAGTTAPHLGPLIDVRGHGGLVIAGGSYSPVQEIPYRRASPPGSRPVPLPPWLLAMLRRPAPAAPAAAPRPASAPTAAAGTRAERYAEAALRNTEQTIRALREGDDRRNKVYSAAIRLGELHHTAPDILTEAAVRDALMTAALACGIKGGESQAEKCITNGWARGLRTTAAGAA